MKFLGQMLFGIQASRDTLMSEIARPFNCRTFATLPMAIAYTGGYMIQYAQFVV